MYAENFSFLTDPPVKVPLRMDVYSPEGDTLSKRPLIILMHAGSYLPKGFNQLPFGNKEDSCMVEMCKQFAKRGWVAVSMDYRLGWNPLSDQLEVRAGTIMNAVYRSMQDAKACVRFFKKDAATNKTYKIDTTKITVGGSNSGGYTALTVGYLNQVSEINLEKFLDGNQNSFINQAIFGGFDGEDGHPDYNFYNHPEHTSDVQLILTMGGAIGDTIWMEEGDIPVVAFHGVADLLTPYGTAIVIVAATQEPIIEVSGSHDIARYANSLGIQDTFINADIEDAYTLVAESRSSFEGLFPFPGLANGFEPWAWYDPDDPNAVGSGSAVNPYATKEKALLYIDTIMGYFCPRAVVALDLYVGFPAGVNKEVVTQNNLRIFPNPSSNYISIISTKEPIFSIEVYNSIGQLVRKELNVNSHKYTLNKNNLNSGIYFLNVKFKNSNMIKSVIFK